MTSKIKTTVRQHWKNITIFAIDIINLICVLSVLQAKGLTSSINVAFMHATLLIIVHFLLIAYRYGLNQNEKVILLGKNITILAILFLFRQTISFVKIQFTVTVGYSVNYIPKLDWVTIFSYLHYILLICMLLFLCKLAYDVVKKS